MPQVTVYIREQDLETWKRIQKKSEWLHGALNNDETLKQFVFPKAIPDSVSIHE